MFNGQENHGKGQSTPVGFFGSLTVFPLTGLTFHLVFACRRGLQYTVQGTEKIPARAFTDLEFSADPITQEDRQG
jgi:hypothetical protein